jgi:UDP-glucose:(heptosyl)LPS alpha-1,3-glucosyltransferase
MKIALIRKKYSDFGGAELYIKRLAEGLAGSGHEVHFFASSWKTKSEESGIIFHKVPSLDFFSLTSLLSFLFFLKIRLKKEKFDIIHSFERTPSQHIYRAGDGCHKEWLFQRARHRGFLKKMMMRFSPLHICLLLIEKKIFEKGNYQYIIANSKMVKENIMKHYGVPEEKIRVIYNSVDRERFSSEHKEEMRIKTRKEYKIDSNDTLISFVGSGFERKGLGFAIRAVKALQDRKYKLIVVGKGSIGKYEKLAESLSVRDQIIFTGPLFDTSPIYAASDVFLLPTLYDPFSNASLEAVASGLPVITTKMNGASEIIMEGENGFVIKDPRDIKEISQKINLSLNLDREKFHRVNEGILKKFIQNSDVEETISLYQEVINGSCL